MNATTKPSPTFKGLNNFCRYLKTRNPISPAKASLIESVAHNGRGNKPNQLASVATPVFIPNQVTTLSRILSPRKVNPVIENAFYSLDKILEDISRDNFKTDYRTDKTRDIVIDLINRVKNFFEKVICARICESALSQTPFPPPLPGLAYASVAVRAMHFLT